MKKLSISIISLMLLLIFGSSFASEHSKVITDDLINSIELKVQASIEDDSLNGIEKYSLYSSAAWELLRHRHYEESLKYYELAIESKLDKGMEEAYYNKLFIKYQLKQDSTELVKSLKEFESYLTTSKSIDEYSYILSSWKLMLSEDTNAEITSSNALFAQKYSQDKMKILVKEKQYAQALQLLPEDLGHSNINFQIQSDILKTILFGRTQKLYCDKKLKKYPNSFAYTMEICRYLKDSKLITLSVLESRIKEQSPSRLYWLDAMKEIK